MRYCSYISLERLLQIEKVIRLCTVLNFGRFEDRAIFHISQLSYDGGGGLCAHYRSIDKIAQSAPLPIFICENNRKSNKIMHCVEFSFFWIGSFEDKGIFHVIL